MFFNTATGKDERRMPLPASAFTLAFAPDGSTLAAGDLANITLLNVATGKVQAPVPEPKGTPFATQFRAGGKQLISFGTDGVYWWDLAGGQIVRHFQYEQPGPRPLLGHVLSPDEKVIVTSGSGGDLELVDVAANKQLHTLKGHKFPRSAAFSPDGSRLYSAGNGRVIVWDVQNGKQLLEWESPNVANLAVSPDGRWVAYWTSDRIGNSFARNKPPEGTYDIRLWDVGAGKLARRLTLRGGAALDAVFSADSTRLVIVGGDPGQHGFSSSTLGKSNVLQIWDVATGTEVRTFRGNQERAICVAISPDGRTIATGKWDFTHDGAGTDYALHLWDVATGTERGQILGHQSRVQSVNFSPDGRWLAATSADAPIFIWDVYALKKPLSPAKGLTKEDKDKLWQELASADATKAFQAVRELIARPDEAVSLLQAGWKRVPRATTEQMQKWIEDLDSNQSSVREKAQAELDLHLAGHEQLLSKALAKSTLEQRNRLAEILNRLHPGQLQRTRMLEVLERIGSGPSRQFLQTLAGQTDDVETSREATAGLERLKR